MCKADYRLVFLMCLCLLGALSSGWATTRTVPAPRGGGLDDSANIQAVINQAQPGDTVSFQTGASYSVAATLNPVGGTSGSTVTYAGNSCTLNWTSTTAGNMLYLINKSYIYFGGFILNMSANSGNVMFDQGCTNITFINNTVENNSYSGGNYGLQYAIFSSCNSGGTAGLTNSGICYNNFNNLTGTSANPMGAMMIYGPNQLAITDNTFSNIPYTNCISVYFTNSSAPATGMFVCRNTATNNCARMALEMGNDGCTYPSTTGMVVQGNIFSVAAGFDGNQIDLSIVNSGTGTQITDNILSSPSNTTGWALEYATAVGQPGNALIQNNIVKNIAWGLYNDDYNDNDVFNFNLFANLTQTPMGDNNQVNDGGAADIFQNNWLYGCTTGYANNANLSGTCPTVSIAGAQNGSDGTFTISSSIAPSQNTAVTYAVSGTGIPGTDYTALSGTATILAGQTSVTVPVTHLNSNHGNVTVIATLTFGPYYINSAANAATVTINTTPALPTVTVTASPTSINEKGGTSTYTVTRTGATTSALAVNYAMSGTASNGTDYNTLSGSLTIASGSATGTVTLTAKDRGLTSGSKTAILTISANANYTVGSPSNATVTINDNDSLPTVTVAASPTSINEKNGTSTYTVTRTVNTVAALTVNYAMSGTAVNGTDYTTLSGGLTIAAGASTGTVTLTTIDRGITLGSVTAILTLSSNANYTVGSPSSATVTILDNDTPPIPTANLSLWLKADAGVTKNGSNQVSAWADQSGSSMNGTGQGTTNPLWVSNTLNGYPVMRFDGASNYFSLPSGFANFTAGTSIFIVVKPSVVTFNAHFLDFSAGTANNVMSLNRCSSSNDVEYAEYISSWTFVTDSGAIPVGTASLLEMVQTAAGAVTLYKNSTSQATGTMPLPSNITRTGNWIAKSDSGVDALYEGDIAEVIVYNAALSTANRQTVESYLRTKYSTW